MTVAGTEDLFDEENPVEGEVVETGDGESKPVVGVDPKDKRINDLMSKADKETARANKLEAILKKVKDAGDDTVPGVGRVPVKEPEVPAEVRRWLDAAKGTELDRLYGSDPRFAAYGVDKDVINGDTPEAMSAAVVLMGSLIDKIETVVRNETLAAHGITPSVVGGGASKELDIAGMSDEAFKTFLAKNSSRSGLF